jgi:hypothetical protein
MKLISLLLIATIPAPSARAQTQSPPTVHQTTAFGFAPAGTFVSPKPRMPFSGVLTVRAEQTLSDGIRIDHDNEEVVMRDGMGRVYRARELKTPDARNPGPRVLFTILDPVQKVQYTCMPIKICRRMQYRPFMPHPPLGLNSDKGKDVTIEDLGPSNVNGLEVQGKRLTRLIPAGKVGNDLPFTSTEEQWHSRELDLDIVSKKTDPRWGTRTAELIQIVLGEPDPKYFQVPEGYRLQEGGPLSVAVAPSPADGESSFPKSLPPNP